MFSFLGSFVIPREEALAAWRRFDIKDPEDAHRMCKKYLPAWKSLMGKHGFVSMFEQLPNHEELGRLKNDAFWKMCWFAFEKECNKKDPSLKFRDKKEEYAHWLRPHQLISTCIGEAAFLGNMSVFDMATNIRALASIKHTMSSLSSFVSPKIISWIGDKDVVREMWSEELSVNQENKWRSLDWENKNGVSPFLFIDADSLVAQMKDGFSRYALNRKEQACAIGHFFHHCPTKFFRDDAPGGPIMRRLQKTLGPHLVAGVEIDTIALCCGLDLPTLQKKPNTTTVDIAILGRNLRSCTNESEIQHLPSGPVNILQSLYSITTAWELYDAVQTSGIHRQVETPTGPKLEEFNFMD